MSKACLCASCAFGPGPAEVPKYRTFDADVFCDIGDVEKNDEGVERSKPGYVFAFFSEEKTAHDCCFFSSSSRTYGSTNSKSCLITAPDFQEGVSRAGFAPRLLLCHTFHIFRSSAIVRPYLLAILPISDIVAELW